MSTDGRGSGLPPGAPAGSRSRDKERTRWQILTAAERVVAERGSSVSLAVIAAEAGVSKSGLLHHFPSRDALVEALITHVIERVWEEVEAQQDPADRAPGAYCRAYVRAMTGDSAYLADLHSPTGLMARVGSEVAAGTLSPIATDDPARVNAAFAADGLPEGRTLAVRYAAEGVALSLNTPYLSEAQRLTVRDELFALTRP